MSVVRTLVVAAAMTAAFAGAAYARNSVATAQFEAPASQARVVADSAVWSCDGATCRALPIHDISVRACHALAREAGAHITAYGNETRQLSSDELARCNGDAATVQQARN